MTNYLENNVNGGIPLTNATINIVDIPEYLEFVLYDKVWFKDNATISPSEPGRWLGISYRTGMLICYHILPQTGRVIYRSMVQRVNNINLSTDEVKENLVKLYAEIHQRLKLDNRGYEG